MFYHPWDASNKHGVCSLLPCLAVLETDGACVRVGLLL